MNNFISLRLVVLRTVFFAALISVLALLSCNESGGQMEVKGQPSSTAGDSIKQVPPPDFISTCARINERNLDTFINRIHGFWYIKSGWFHPYFIRLRDLPMFTKQENLKFSKVKEEDLPQVDCDLPPPHWTKNGCFAREENTFVKDSSWTQCELSEKDKEEVAALAKTIRWTVINSKEGKYYFSLIDGAWYLTFVDLRRPCEKPTP